MSTPKLQQLLRFALLLILAWTLLPPVEPLAGKAGEETARDERSADINCFAYHRFGDDRYPSTNISLETFRKQLEHLHRNGFTVLTLGQALDALWSDSGLSGKTAVLTVDDGYETFLTGAMPLLRKYGYRATLFVNTGNVGGKGYLDWSELRELRKEGVEIGNHSHGHPHFLNYPREKRAGAFRRDVLAAQKTFQERMGFKPELFSYPYGEYDPEMKEALREMGMKAAVAQKSGVIYSGSDRYALPRFPMGGPYATLRGFRDKIGMRALPVRKASPESPVVKGGSPPVLELVLDPSIVDMQGVQCFVQGERACRIRRDSDVPGRIRVQATKGLTARRTLYTVTAPSATGSAWHWYSHLWVRPAIKESGH